MIFCSGRTLRAALICGTALVAAPTIAQEVFFDGVNAQAFVQGALDAGFSQSDIVIGCIADDAAPGGDGSSSLGGFVSVTIAGSSTTVFLGEPCALAGGDPPDDDDDDGDDNSGSGSGSSGSGGDDDDDDDDDDNDND